MLGTGKGRGYGPRQKQAWHVRTREEAGVAGPWGCRVGSGLGEWSWKEKEARSDPESQGKGLALTLREVERHETVLRRGVTFI